MHSAPEEKSLLSVNEKNPLRENPTVWDYLMSLPERLELAREKKAQEEELAPNNLKGPGPSIVNPQRASQAAPFQKSLKFIEEINGAWLAFGFGLLVYLLTRFVQIDKFPIYFFCDEAIQTMSAVDLIANGFKDQFGHFLPTYFMNSGQFNLSFSVYWQLLPAMLTRSIVITRGISALATLMFPLSLGLALKDVFKRRLWYLAPLIVAAIPTWFLHSRTAFETALGSSLFSLFIYFYLKYRTQSAKFIYPALLFGALAFYTYSPLQLVVFASGAVLLIVDLRYHLKNWRTLLPALLFLAVLAAPYLHFSIENSKLLRNHLNLLHSYWLEPNLSLPQKLWEFFKRYLEGLNPGYWFLPNAIDLIRHQMKGMGHLPLLFATLALIGLWQAFKKYKDVGMRVILIAFFVSPMGAALAEPQVTRLMMMVVPWAYFTLLGLNCVVEKVFGGASGGISVVMPQTATQPAPYQRNVQETSPASNARRTAAVSASLSAHLDDALPAFPKNREGKSARSYLAEPSTFNRGKIAVIGIAMALLLWTGWMTREALINGPTWYNDYTLYGLQWGAQEVFGEIKAQLIADPQKEIVITPSWANNTDVLARFFLGDPLPIEFRSINSYLEKQLPISSKTLFVLTPEEVYSLQKSGKFEAPEIVKILNWPDGRPGFYFLHAAYTEDASTIFEQEAAELRKPMTDVIEILGQKVPVEFSRIDMNQIWAAFDNDERTLTRTYEANPFEITLNFPQVVSLKGVSVAIGAPETRVMAEITHLDGSTSRYSKEINTRSTEIRRIELPFDTTEDVKTLKLIITDTTEQPPTHVHVWDIVFRQ